MCQSVAFVFIGIFAYTCAFPVLVVSTIVFSFGICVYSTVYFQRVYLCVLQVCSCSCLFICVLHIMYMFVLARLYIEMYAVLHLCVPLCICNDMLLVHTYFLKQQCMRGWVGVCVGPIMCALSLSIKLHGGALSHLKCPTRSMGSCTKRLNTCKVCCQLWCLDLNGFSSLNE